jgi:hypothetical protein
MKKLISILAGLFIVIIINAQSLEEILKKYSVANKQEQISKLNTLKITANMSMMGMEMPMTMWMKNPDKIKSVTSFNGQEMISVFDGEKGYMTNPMSGSSEPIVMTPDQVRQATNNNIFQNYLVEYYKKGQLVLSGEENVKGKPAFKLKANIDGGSVVDLYIDKSTYYIIKTVAEVKQEGTAINIETYPSEYTEINGIVLPMKSTSVASGMEFVIKFVKIEANIPMDDSLFKIK